MNSEPRCCGFSRRLVVQIVRGLALVAVLLALGIPAYRWVNPLPPADPSFVKRLEQAHHFKSSNPGKITRPTPQQIKDSGWKRTMEKVFGIEIREVSHMATNAPSSLFALLSHIGGYGEVLWVDNWMNFPVRLPPSLPTTVPGHYMVRRRTAVKAALKALDDAGACIIKAGKNRHLVCRKSEKDKWKAAIRELGWLEGKEFVQTEIRYQKGD